MDERGIVIINNSKIRPFDVGIKNNIFLFYNKMFNGDRNIDWEKIFFKNLKTNKIKLNLGDKKIQKDFEKSSNI